MGRKPAVTKDEFVKALIDNDYQMTSVAKQLGVCRATAYSYLQMYQIEIKREIRVKPEYNKLGSTK